MHILIGNCGINIHFAKEKGETNLVNLISKLVRRRKEGKKCRL